MDNLSSLSSTSTGSTKAANSSPIVAKSKCLKSDNHPFSIDRLLLNESNQMLQPNYANLFNNNSHKLMGNRLNYFNAKNCILNPNNHYYHHQTSSNMNIIQNANNNNDDDDLFKLNNEILPPAPTLAARFNLHLIKSNVQSEF